MTGERVTCCDAQVSVINETWSQQTADTGSVASRSSGKDKEVLCKTIYCTKQLNQNEKYQLFNESLFIVVNSISNSLVISLL